MLNTHRIRFSSGVILVCIRWYATYPLRYRHVEKMMRERGVFVEVIYRTILCVGGSSPLRVRATFIEEKIVFSN